MISGMRVKWEMTTKLLKTLTATSKINKNYVERYRNYQSPRNNRFSNSYSSDAERENSLENFIELALVANVFSRAFFF